MACLKVFLWFFAMRKHRSASAKCHWPGRWLPKGFGGYQASCFFRFGEEKNSAFCLKHKKTIGEKPTKPVWHLTGCIKKPRCPKSCTEGSVTLGECGFFTGYWPVRTLYGVLQAFKNGALANDGQYGAN